MKKCWLKDLSVFSIVAPFPGCTRPEQGAGHSIEALEISCSLAGEALSCFFQQPKVKKLAINFAWWRASSWSSIWAHHWWIGGHWYGWSSWEWHPISCEQQKQWKKIHIFMIEIICHVKSPNSCDVNGLLWAPGGVFLQSSALAPQLWGMLLLPCAITCRRTIIPWSPRVGVPISYFKYSKKPTLVTWRHQVLSCPSLSKAWPGLFGSNCGLVGPGTWKTLLPYVCLGLVINVAGWM